MFTGWGNATSKRVKLIKDHMYDPLKFTRHEWESIKNLKELRKNIAHDYYNGWKD